MGKGLDWTIRILGIMTLIIGTILIIFMLWVWLSCLFEHKTPVIVEPLSQAQEVTGNILPPKHIQIKGSDWRLTPDDHIISQEPNTITWAWTDCEAKIIYYNPDFPKSITLTKDGHDFVITFKETIVHEIFHAGTCDGNQVDNKYWNSLDEKHVGIYRLAEFWTMVIQQNPALMKWIGN